MSRVTNGTKDTKAVTISRPTYGDMKLDSRGAQQLPVPLMTDLNMSKIVESSAVAHHHDIQRKETMQSSTKGEKFDDDFLPL